MADCADGGGSVDLDRGEGVTTEMSAVGRLLARLEQTINTMRACHRFPVQHGGVDHVFADRVDEWADELEAELRVLSSALGETARATVPEVDRIPHPGYGPCDGMGPGGLCSECSGEIELNVDDLRARIENDMETLAGELQRLQRKRAEHLASKT